MNREGHRLCRVLGSFMQLKSDIPGDEFRVSTRRVTSSHVGRYT